jgi:Protein of unknown function (DUF2997)
MKKIVVKFDKQGHSTVEAFGFSDAGCLQATKEIEDAIGKVGKRTKKGGGDVEVALATVSS